jgi:hypothetical protein
MILAIVCSVAPKRRYPLAPGSLPIGRLGRRPPSSPPPLHHPWPPPELDTGSPIKSKDGGSRVFSYSSLFPPSQRCSRGWTLEDGNQRRNPAPCSQIRLSPDCGAVRCWLGSRDSPASPWPDLQGEPCSRLPPRGGADGCLASNAAGWCYGRSRTRLWLRLVLVLVHGRWLWCRRRQPATGWLHRWGGG